ncbi:hypothetical protein Ndes2437A_g03376 [Nannochloris sp. 'desiccata']
MEHQTEQTAAYIDEEDCLGFKIWVAELELIVGSSRGKKKADPTQAFVLLQKLVITLDRTDRTEVRKYQRRCEDALIDILLKGAPPPVRRLVCEALGKLYARGDQLPLFSRVSSLQLFLGTKEAFGKETSEEIRLGGLELMTSLYYSQGRSLSIGVLETAAMAVKYCGKGSGSDRTRRAALRLMAAAVEGVGGSHRNAAAVQNEVLKAITSILREKNLGELVKLGIADVLRAIAASGGAQLWSNSLTAYEFARTSCLAGVHDPSPAVRAAYAHALGEIVTASTSDDAKHSIAALEGKQKHQQLQERSLSLVADQCLGAPFAEAAATSDRLACTAIAQAWVFHLAEARFACGADEAAFVEPALKPLEALRVACLAAKSYPEKGPSGHDIELGMGIGGGERPHAQACILYIMRAGAIEQLGEIGQRLLLEKVTSLLNNNFVSGGGVGAGASADSTNAAAAAAAPGLTPVGIVALEIAALLTEALGEVGSEAATALEIAIASKLIGPHAALRLQAASALAALAVAEPARAGKLLGSALVSLRSAADKVVEGSAAGPDRSKPGPGTPRGPGSGKLKLEMNALHGWALGSAALLAATPRLSLGVPSHYIKVAVQLAAALIEAPRTQFAAATCLEREAGYIMLGVLCHVALEEVMAVYNGETVLFLWKPALSAEATAALDSSFADKDSEFTLASELWWRTAAVQSLTAFIQRASSDTCCTSSDNSELLLVGVSDLLRPMLGLLSSQQTLRHPSRARGGPGSPLAGAAAMMQLRLLNAYALLCPLPKEEDAQALGSLCIDAIKSAATGPGNSGAVGFLIPALQSALDPLDGHIGPWEGGRDPLERDLLQFQGAVGGPAPPAWQIGLRSGIGYAVDILANGNRNTISSPQQVKYNSSNTPSMYPQPVGLGPALLAAQSHVLGAVLRCATPEQQLPLLGALLAVSKAFPVGKKDKDGPRRLVAVLIASAPVISGFDSTCSFSSLGGGGSGGGGGGGKNANTIESQAAAEKVRALAEAATAESAAGVLPQRVASGLYAAAARLSGDVDSIQLLKMLCKEAAETASLPQRAAQALAVGSTSRAVGGLGLASVLPLAADTLSALAGASDSSIAPAILHSLIVCSQAAGLSFLPHVRSTLSLMQKMLLSEDIYSVPGLLPAVGRLANAMVAALGPDYVLGSSAYDSCRSVMAELRAPDASGVRRPEDSLASSLQSVLYAQMLVLFAPLALPAAQHVAVLVGTLPSRQPQLRKAAADTLRHLAERDAEAVLLERIEPALLAALDGETDPATAAQLQATLSTLLEAGAAAQPSRWITLCGEIISAAGPADLAGSLSKSKANSDGGVGGLGGGLGTDGDSDIDDDVGGLEKETTASPSKNTATTTTPVSSAVPSSSAIPPQKNSTQQVQHQASLTPRLRTRIFAAKCLLRVPGMAAVTDPLHSDLALAQSDPTSGDWLVLKLQALVDLGFKMATGQLDALRALGVDLMIAVLTHLGDASDPFVEEVEGAKLLAQYQAQYVSTLRASLAPDASPEVGASGAALAAAFLEKGLAAGDAVVMERLMGLLCAPLSGWASGGADPAQAAYAEWVTARARVALLESHAHCAALGAATQNSSSGGEDLEISKGLVVRAQGPFLTLLVECWIGLLHDYAVLCTRGTINTHQGYKLGLFGSGGAPRAPLLSVVAQGIEPALRHAWPVTLEASTYTLAHDRTVSYGAPGKERHAALVDLTLAAADWTMIQMRQQNKNHSRTTSGGFSHGIGGGLSSSSGTSTNEGGNALFMSVVLRALQRLTAPRFAKEGWLTTGVITELTQVTVQALPLLRSSGRSSPLAALEIASVVLAQLSAIAASGKDAAGAEELLLSGVDECLRMALTQQSTPALAAALAALTRRVIAAKNTGAYSALLHRSLTEGLGVLGKQQSSKQAIEVAAEHILATAKAAAMLSADATSGLDSMAGPLVDEVLTAAAATAAQQAQQAASVEEPSQYQVGANLSCALALGAFATVDTSKEKNGTDKEEETDKDDEWGNAPFTSATAPTPFEITAQPLFKTSPTQQLCLDTLQNIVADASPCQNSKIGVKLQAAGALATYLQGHPPPLWASQCAAVGLPPALTALHALLQRPTAIEVTTELQFAVETLKCGLISCNLGGNIGDSCLTLVVPIMVESAAPSGQPTPILAEAAVRLLVGLASGPAAAAFKGVVAALPESTRQRLQRALASVASTGSATEAPGAAPSTAVSGHGRPSVPAKLPSIQLKKFAAPP